jgi:DNA-binding transcriptional LysR family regulator
LPGVEGVEPEALAAERLILRERGSGVRLLIDTVFRERGLEVRPVWESVSTGAIIRAVEAGLGVSILPVQLVKDAVDSGKLVRVPVKGVEFRRSFSIVTHKNKFRTPALEAFIAVCRGGRRGRL